MEYKAKNRLLNLTLTIVTAIIVFFIIDFRSLNFPDDLEYARIYSEISDSYDSASQKYGLTFKYYVSLSNFAFPGDLNKIFSLIPVLIACCVAFTRVRNAWILFVAILVTFPIVWFVQLRQGLAMAFILVAVTSKNRTIGHFSSLLSLMAHFSVAPFLLWYYLIAKSRIKFLGHPFASVFLGVAFINILYAIIIFRSEVSEITGFPLTLYLSTEALYLGRLGLGGVLIFYILCAALLACDCMSGRILFSITIFGSVIFFISTSIPLLQRFILPFTLYLLVIFFTSTKSSITVKFAVLGLLSGLFFAELFDTFGVSL
jgi:hypothetical protein